MGCGQEPSPHVDTQVRLEFSTNHGLTWHLVKEVRNMASKQKTYAHTELLTDFLGDYVQISNKTSYGAF